MKESFGNLIAVITEAYPDVLKAEEGNKAAAARLRKQLKNVKFLIKKIVDQSREIKTKGSV